MIFVAIVFVCIYIYIYICLFYITFRYIYIHLYMCVMCIYIIYIYDFSIVYRVEVSVTVKQVFACEIDDAKRDFLMATHPDIEHVFADVIVFTKGSGFCYKCQKVHSTGPDVLKVDLAAAGPSCKDLSMNNAARKDFAGAYEEGAVGTSATTYQHGVKSVP